MKRGLQIAAEGWLLALTFLLPLKFGVIAVMPDACAFFADNWFSWCIVNWPATAFGLFSAPALVLAVAAYPEASAKVRHPGWIFAVLWSLGLLLGSLPGLIHLSSLDFAFLQIGHFAAIGCYAAAAWLVASSGEAARKRLAAALGMGMILTVGFGLEQYFWGFERSRRFLEEQAANGVAVGEVLRARTFDTRVFSTFTSSNSLAGYLLLLASIAIVWAWRIGGRFEPERVSRRLFAGLTAGASFAVFLMTKSRAGFLALAVAAALALLCVPMKKAYRIALACVIAAAVAGGAWFIHAHGRGFRSMTARADYLRSSAILLAQSPLAGCGWGEFFYDHVRIKRVQDHEAAHDPHNILMTAAQAGLLDVLIVAAGLLIPAAVLLRKRKRAGKLSPGTWAGLFGLAAFYLHAMMDIDVQIPGLMASYFALGALLLAENASDDPPVCPRIGPAVRVLWILLACGAFWIARAEVRGEKRLDDLQNLTRLGSLTPEERAQVTPERVAHALDRALAARPYSSQPHSAAGDYFLSIGDIDRAESDYRKALAKAPKRASLYARLARIALLRGDAEQARKLMKKAAELFPNHPDYRTGN